MKYIDVHCHPNLPEFDTDFNEALLRAKEKGVGLIVVGVDKKTSERAVKIAEENENVWAVIGHHPVDNTTEPFDTEFYKTLASNSKVVGLGECGFDYYHASPEDKERQREIFEKHIQISLAVNKPLVLHLRNGKGTENAYKDALEILKKYPSLRGDVHFFAGTLEDAQEFIKLGFKLSFTGVITFAKNYDEIIKNIPLESIMSETDAPYVAPVPYRGKRNEPVYVIEVAHRIAEIRGESLEKVLPQLVENARNLFGLNS